MLVRKKDKKPSSARLGITSFVSFGDVVDSQDESEVGSPLPEKTGNLLTKGTPVYTGDSPELRFSCKKLLKKDSVTKQKALQEILAIFESTETSAAKSLVAGFCTFFCYVLSRYCLDDTWQIRERLGKILLKLIEYDRPSLSSVMQDIIGPWWQLAADPVIEVQQCFQTAFDKAFAFDRQASMLIRFSTPILQHVDRFLKMSPAELHDISQCELSELDEKYERMMVSNLQCLKRYLELVSAEHNEVLCDIRCLGLVSYVSLLSTILDVTRSTSQQGSVRRTGYALIIEIVGRLEGPMATNFLQSKSDEMFGAALMGVELSNESDTAEAMHTLHAVASRFPTVWRQDAQIINVLQKMKLLLRKNATLVQQYLLPVISTIPSRQLGVCVDIGNKSQGTEVLRCFVSLLVELKQSKAATPSDKLGVSVCILECLTFFLLRKESDGILYDEHRFQLVIPHLLTAFMDFWSILLMSDIDSDDQSSQTIQAGMSALLALLRRITSNQSQLSCWLNEHLWQQASRSFPREIGSRLICEGQSTTLFWKYLGQFMAAAENQSNGKRCEPVYHFASEIVAATVDLIRLAVEDNHGDGRLNVGLKTLDDLLTNAHEKLNTIIVTVLFTKTGLECILSAMKLLDEVAVLTNSFSVVAAQCCKSILVHCLNIVFGCSDEEHVAYWQSFKALLFDAMSSTAFQISIQHANRVSSFFSFSFEEQNRLRAYLRDSLMSGLPSPSMEHLLLDLGCSLIHSCDLDDVFVTLLELAIERSRSSCVCDLPFSFLVCVAVTCHDLAHARSASLHDLLADRTLSTLLVAEDLFVWEVEKGIKFLDRIADGFLDPGAINWLFMGPNFGSLVFNRLLNHQRHELHGLVSSRIDERLLVSNQMNVDRLQLMIQLLQKYFMLRQQCEIQIPTSLMLFSTKYWSVWQSKLQSEHFSVEEMDQLRLSIECIHSLFSVIKSDWFPEPSLFVVLVVCCQQILSLKSDCASLGVIPLVTAATTAFDVLLDEFTAKMSSDDKIDVIKAFQAKLEFSCDEEPGRAAHPYIYSVLVSRIFNGVQRCFSRNATWMRHIFPARSISTHSCVYVSAIELEEGRTLFRAEPAKVVCCHMEDGPFHPYFTVVIEESGKEVQTEWSRVLLTQSNGDSLNDCWISSAGAPQKSNCDILTPSDHVVHWLQTAIESVIEILSPHTKSLNELERNVDWESLFCKLVAIERCFPHIMEYLECSNTLPPHEIELQFAAPLRGLAITLSNANLGISSRVLEALASCLRSLFSTSQGIGSGLWITRLLHNLYQSPIIVDLPGLRTRAVELPVVVASYLGVWGAVVDGPYVDSNFARWITQNRLAALFDVVKPAMLGETGRPQLLGFCQYFFRSLADGRTKLKHSGASFLKIHDSEHLICDYALNSWMSASEAVAEMPCQCWSSSAFADGMSVLTKSALVLHYCFLGRDRQSTVQLAKLSTVLMNPDCQRAFVENSVPSLSEFRLAQWYFRDSVRLISAKVADVCMLCRDMDLSSVDEKQIIEDETREIMKEIVDETLCSENISLHYLDDERREDEHNRSTFLSVVGTSLFEKLHERFDIEHVVDRLTHCLAQSLVKITQFDMNNTTNIDVVENLPNDVQEVASILSDLKQCDVSVVRSKAQVRRQASAALAMEDGLGSLLLWLFMVQSVEVASAVDWRCRSRCGSFLAKSGIMQAALDLALSYGGDFHQTEDYRNLMQKSMVIGNMSELADSHARILYNTTSASTLSMQQLAWYCVFRTISTFPANFKSYWQDSCGREEKSLLSKFVEERAREYLIDKEIALIQLSKKQERWNESEFSMRSSAASGEIVATLMKDETKIEILIRIPKQYPLQKVEVECTSRFGVTDGIWRRWLLQMTQLMSSEDGSVVDAALLWKSNVEKELEGVEPCPICYCTIHSKTLKLPSIACSTCHNKFHPVCLHTWFKTSGKSKCVLCQQPMKF